MPGARSADSLGNEREGTGVVIGDNGLVLTIGYLIVEADDVKITDAKGRTLPARVVGYDHASGFGLVRARRCRSTRSRFRSATPARPRSATRCMIASAGGDGAAFAWIVSKRQFTGNWEYQLDYALFTSPPTTNWSGAALIDRDGKLLGIGSLIVREATTDDPKLPGNVFVPIDLLKPILADLIREGHRAGPARPWLGVSADEMQGHLLVTRVSPDGPADRAGVSVGDIILGVGTDAVRTQAQFYERVWDRRARGRRSAAQGAAGRGRQGDQGPLDRSRRILPAALDDLTASASSLRREVPAPRAPRALSAADAAFQQRVLECASALSRGGDPRSRPPLHMILFALTIFASAFLLFLVQPIIAKQILPWFGGSAAVWTTCLVFFQAALLAGYAYADVVVRRLDDRKQALLHVALLAASLLVLPIVPGAFWKPSGTENPACADPRPA